MQSEIVPFYKNKTVFITGATGFIGKVIIEKLLRSTEVKQIYCLVRPERGENIEGRFSALKNHELYEVLLKCKPRALEKVTPIAGDCTAPGLGLSEDDRRTLVKEVQIVFHGAASVSFVDPLHDALNINTRAVRLMVQLAKEMKALESFVHISTAYSNCVMDTIHERFYPEVLSCPANKMLELNESLSAGLINKMTSVFLGKFPNTYTFTKALGEQVIQEEAADLPIGILRPAVVVHIDKEPLPGWMEGLQGYVALSFGTAYGIIRLVMTNKKSRYQGVPVDYCANIAMATGWKVAKKPHIDHQTQKKVPPIFCLAVDQLNSISLGESLRQGHENFKVMPNSKMLWYPITNCPFLYKLGILLYHLIPAFFVDLVLRLTGKKPIMLKLYKKVHDNGVIVKPFSTKTFNFDATNTKQLWRLMTSEDQNIFYFDMLSFNWEKNLMLAVVGLRKYMFKEPMTAESIAADKRLLSRYYVLHLTVVSLILSAFGALAWFLLKLVIY